MSIILQKADLWKRTAAWLFDSILLGMLAVGLGVVLSALLGYDAYSSRVDQAYATYEAQYGITFQLTQEEYLAMDEEALANYDAAYEALIADTEAMAAYSMMLNLTLVILSLAILLAVMILEWLVPLRFGNGQTLGKKIFSLCVIRSDGVRMNNMQLFTRSILGKYTIETMIPVLIILMIFWGTMGVAGTFVLSLLAAVQLACLIFTKTNSAIHDLMAGTVVADYSSQTIFRSTEDLIAHKKRVAAERAARATY